MLSLRALRPPLPSVAPATALCADPAGFALIHEPQVQLVLWERRPPAALARWLDGLDLAHLANLRCLLSPAEVRAQVGSALACFPGDAGTAGTLLLEDIAGLAEAFATTLGLARLELRLEALQHDACWRFHRDQVPARLLVTYRGPGTEWVGARHSEEALRAQRDYAGPLRRLARFDAALFKGSSAPDGPGVVHRSPPIAGTGIGRLLLCLTAPPRAADLC